MTAMAAQSDSAHDAPHIGRVLRTALDIAGHEAQVDEDILTAACLLHDIGRPREIAGKMYTARGRELALQRQKIADTFYDTLLVEIQGEG